MKFVAYKRFNIDSSDQESILENSVWAGFLSSHLVTKKTELILNIQATYIPHLIDKHYNLKLKICKLQHL